MSAGTAWKSLRNCSIAEYRTLLDKYISETLNKESKVVQNWLDALFLQRINYNYNSEEIIAYFQNKYAINEAKELFGMK